MQPHRDYQRKLQEYEETLVEAIQIENPLSPRRLNDLKDYQQHLALEDLDIKPIQERLIGASSIQPVIFSVAYNSPRLSSSEDMSSFEQQVGKSEGGGGQFLPESIDVMTLVQKKARRLGHG